MVEIIDRIRRHFVFRKKEAQTLIIAILIVGFIVGFDDGNVQTTWLSWVFNLINSILIVALAMLVRISMQKIAGLYAGFDVEFNVWWNGLLIGLVFAFMSQGAWWILLPGGFICDMIQNIRLGKFRYGINTIPLAYISLLGVGSNLLLAMFFKLLTYSSFFANNPLVHKAMIINIALAVWTMMPIPLMDGLTVLFATRMIYVFSLAAVIATSILMWYFSILATVIGAFVIAIVVWLLYYIFYESHIWHPTGE